MLLLTLSVLNTYTENSGAFGSLIEEQLGDKADSVIEFLGFIDGFGKFVQGKINGFNPFFVLSSIIIVLSVLISNYWLYAVNGYIENNQGYFDSDISPGTYYVDYNGSYLIIEVSNDGDKKKMVIIDIYGKEVGGIDDIGVFENVKVVYVFIYVTDKSSQDKADAKPKEAHSLKKEDDVSSLF